MELFWKASGFVLIAVILGLAIGKSDYSVILSVTACCIVGAASASLMAPVLDLLWEIEALGQLQNELLGTLIKAVGISLVAELAATICSDAGNGALGKTLHMLGSAVILYISIPVFRGLLMLIREILGVL